MARGEPVQFSLGAVEAAHVPAPARPALGKGLSARATIYRNVWREGTGYGLALGAGSDAAIDRELARQMRRQQRVAKFAAATAASAKGGSAAPAK